MHATLSQQNPNKCNQQGWGGKERQAAEHVFLPHLESVAYPYTQELFLSHLLTHIYVWYITAKQFSAISAIRGYNVWSLIRVNYEHSGDSNLFLSLKLLLPNDHHQIWQMGLRPVFILTLHMASMQG